LEAEVKRMLKDVRSNRFVRHFVEQWLDLDGLQSISHITDQHLLKAMQEEPIAFFQEVLRSNSSIFDFIHSDYALVNERLASHYKIRDCPRFSLSESFNRTAT
jgi:hypothetical protein